MPSQIVSIKPTMLDSISALIRSRRSIKPVDMETAREVPETLIWQLLENASWAPTHGLTEPWKFHVFEGAARQRLATAMHQIYHEVTPAAEFRPEKAVKMSQNPLLAPVVIACCAEKRGGEKIPFLEEIEAVACALQNLMLSATAAGLASFWSSPPLLATAAFNQWLELSPEDQCVGLMYLGWPKPERALLNPGRRPVSEKTVWHRDPV
jgi:nitroreductase